MKALATLNKLILATFSFTVLATTAIAGPAQPAAQFRCTSGEAGFGTLDLYIGKTSATNNDYAAIFTNLDIVRFDVKGQLVEKRHIETDSNGGNRDEDFQARFSPSTNQYLLRVPASKIDWTSPQAPSTSCYGTSTTPGAWLNINAAQGGIATDVVFIAGELNPNHTWTKVLDGMFYQDHPVVNGRVCDKLAPSKKAKYPVTCTRVN